MRVLKPISMAAISSRLESAPLSFVAAAGAPPLLETLQGIGPALKAAAQEGSACVPLVVGPEGDFTGAGRAGACTPTACWPHVKMIPSCGGPWILKCCLIMTKALWRFHDRACQADCYAPSLPVGFLQTP